MMWETGGNDPICHLIVGHQADVGALQAGQPDLVNLVCCHAYKVLSATIPGQHGYTITLW
jgi:hypothetical protein